MLWIMVPYLENECFLLEQSCLPDLQVLPHLLRSIAMGMLRTQCVSKHPSTLGKQMPNPLIVYVVGAAGTTEWCFIGSYAQKRICGNRLSPVLRLTRCSTVKWGRQTIRSEV